MTTETKTAPDTAEIGAALDQLLRAIIDEDAKPRDSGPIKLIGFSLRDPMPTHAERELSGILRDPDRETPFPPNEQSLSLTFFLTNPAPTSRHMTRTRPQL